MEFLAITWILWLILSALSVGGVLFYRRTRKRQSSMLITAQDLSVKTLMLDVRKGDGDIFLGYLLSMVFFSLFLAGFAHWVRGLL
jgi:hypothetical protein